MQRTGDQKTRMSYLPDLNDYRDDEFDEDEEKSQGPDEETQGWDVFKFFPPMLKTGSKANTKFFDRTAKVAKFFTYFVLFIFILGGGIIAKTTILFAASQIDDHGPVKYCDYNEIEKRTSGRNLSALTADKYRVGWYWCIILAFAFSEILRFINAIYHWFFKKRFIPRKIDVLVLLIVDTFHTVGLALLFFLVLPRLNSIQAIVVSSCTCLVPALLVVLSGDEKQHPSGKSFAVLVGDVAALVGQLFGAIIWIFPDNNVTMATETKCILPIALTLVSCRWWGNYTSEYSNFGEFHNYLSSIKYTVLRGEAIAGCLIFAMTIFSIFFASIVRFTSIIIIFRNNGGHSNLAGFMRVLSQLKRKLEGGRGITQGCSAVWRILTFFVTSISIAYLKGHELTDFFNKNILIGAYNVTLVDLSKVAPSTMKNSLSESVTIQGNPGGFLEVDSYRLPLMFFIVHVASSFMTYSSGKFAYRTMMQGYGFALPINLVVPGAFGTIVLISVLRNIDTCMFHNFLPDHVSFNVPPEHIESLSGFMSHWCHWVWLVTLPSQAWITRRIWSPHAERLAATEHIFLVPTYDSLIIDQSMVLNRRKNENHGEVPVAERLENVSEVEIDITYRSSKSALSEIEQNDRVARIIVCATMWHETEREMTEFVGSILRLDMDQGTKRFTQGYYNLRIEDYYELQTHVFFDDAFRCMHGCETRCKHDENETQVNDYVMTLINTMQKSVESLHMLAKPPKKYPSPYGGRLEWSLPGRTRMIVHLKDKNKIRHRKRWSQVMYMYYLLGYSLMDTNINEDRKEIIAENTYLLTLDGDIDFQPSAVKVLVDLMKRDKDLGAACGRIHPVGTGPMVWFQKFEYAIGHWLQKSTEHTIGSVLCSPGAFSLFRAKALMEHNVMRKYATESTEPMHYVQYDQGEDRWLCTLILQVGYRVEYSAASDSYTHAPETFNEFYNQRRRWIPSTIANIFDLLSTSKETRKANDDISLMYVAYQWVLMGSTVLGPGTIFLMLVGAFVAAFRIDNWSSFSYNLIPILMFIVVCWTCKASIQLLVAGIITAFYGLVMIVVLIGIMIQIAEDGWVAPSTILFFVIAGQIIIAGLLHPQEWSCLLCGLIYYITVPSMYMLLIIFALFNVNNVTWGTRDSKANVAQETEKTAKGDRTRKNTIGSKISNKNDEGRGSVEFSLAGLFKCILCTQNGKSDEEQKFDAITESLDRIVWRLNTMENNTDENEPPKSHRSETFSSRTNEYSGQRPADSEASERDSENYTAGYEDEDDNEISENESNIYEDESTRGSGNFLVCPYWLQDERLRKGGVEFLSREEETFWEGLIEKYLQPIEEDKKKIAKTAEGLRELRDEYVFKFFMLNALFVLIVFLMQLNKEILHMEWPLGETYNITYSTFAREVFVDTNYLKLEPIGCLFIIGFVLILGVQFCAMLFHRFNTFSHILANTSLTWPCCNKPTDLTNETDLVKHADDIADGLQRVFENNAESIIQARKTSTVAPGKRKTVHELTESQEKKIKLPANLDTLFRRNLNDTSSEISRFMSNRMPPSVLEAFERRRTTMAANEGNNSFDDAYRNNTDVSDTSERLNSISRANSYAYDNRAFLSDDYSENPPPSNGIMPRRQSQVTFGNANP